MLAGALAALAIVGAAWWLLRPAPPPVEATIPRAEASAGDGGAGKRPGAGVGGGGGGSAPSTSAPAEVVVQAAGAVRRPGVYRLAVGGRVDDLIRAAGGLGDDADGDRVNLAAPVADGERVWVPRRGELAPPVVVAGTGGGGGGGGSGTASSGGSGGTGGAGSAPAEVVSLSTATAEQLDALPGVGPATAAAILAYRQEHGGFSTVDDLLEVRGIGEAKLEQLRPLVRP
jgi:competence protein ComEA